MYIFKIMPLSKTHQDYWTSRLKKRNYKMPSGELRQVEEWQVYIQHRGRREWFKLGSNNKIAASKQAAKIYQSLQVRGWEHTLKDYKPDVLVKESDPTLADFFASAKKASTVDKKTFEKYCRWLRTIVAQLKGLDDDPRKYDAQTGGRKEWVESVDKTRLSYLTPERVMKWQQVFVKKAGEDPIAIRKAEHSANSAVRNARSLFSAKLLKKLKDINLPSPLPFEGVDMLKSGSMRYRSKIDVAELTKAAKSELSTSNPEAYKIFLLSLFAGLRRNEIDKLLWQSIDWKNQSIHIEPHAYFAPKTETSIGTVPVDGTVLQIFKALKTNTVGSYVVYSRNKPRMRTTYAHYRAEKDFKALNKWLRSKGIDANSPIHTLRKEYGRLITEEHGIYAASKALRHAGIQITAAHYADDTRRITVKMNGLK